jgi:hypothetical protein
MGALIGGEKAWLHPSTFTTTYATGTAGLHGRHAEILGWTGLSLGGFVAGDRDRRGP